MSKENDFGKVEIGKGIDRTTKLTDRATLESEVMSSFNESVVEFDVASNERRPYSVILFDIDYFKAVNDLFGHQQGDAVLSGIGDIINEYKESNKDFVGICGRWGGEEFLIALPYDSSKRSRYIGDEIRELVARYSFEDVRTKEKTLRDLITISVGVSSVDIADFMKSVKRTGQRPTPEKIKERLEQLIFESNCAMDYAKFMGKNRVEVFRKYLQSELRSLEQVRCFYFSYSPKKPSNLTDIFKNPFLQKNKSIRNKLKKHFYFIRTEVNPKDTRTQALLADNLSRYIVENYPGQREAFLGFLTKVA